MKPEFRTSKVVTSWPRDARLLFSLLWGYLDDFGRGLDSAKSIAGDCFPYDDDMDTATVDAHLELMTKGVDDEAGPVCRYTVGGVRYIHCVNWSEHQKPNRPTPSRLPACPIHPLAGLPQRNGSERRSDGLSDAYTERFSERRSEPPHATALPGAEEQRSRVPSGARAPSHSLSRSLRTPAAAAAKIIEETTDASPEEATAVAELIAAERRPARLPGLVHRLASDGELGEWLDRVRSGAVKLDVAEQITRARREGELCEHGERGGAFIHPSGGEPLCPQCRSEFRLASAGRP